MDEEPVGPYVGVDLSNAFSCSEAALVSKLVSSGKEKSAETNSMAVSLSSQVVHPPNDTIR